jgi:hypothetical protein
MLKAHLNIFKNLILNIEIGALRRIFGSKRNEVVGGWRRLHSDELHNLYVSPNIIRLSKSRRMR